MDRKVLQNNLEFQTQLLLRDLLDKDEEQAAQKVLWIENSEKAIKWASDSLRSHRNWTLIITGVGFLILGASSFLVPKVTVHLAIEAEKVQLELAENYDDPIEAEEAEYIFTSSLAQLRMPGFVVDEQSKGLVEISGANANLSITNLEAGQTIAFEATGQDTRLHASSGQLTAELSIYEGRIYSPLLEKKEVFAENNSNSPPIRLTAVSIATKILPVSIDWSSQKPTVINNLQINGLSFLRDPEDDGTLQSTVLKGNVRVLGTGEYFPLDFQDEVEIRLIEPALIKMIKIGNTGIQIEMDATVSSLKGGPRNYLRNFKPSIFQYLANNQQIALIWGGLLWLLGILWSLKHSIIKNNK